MQTRFSKSSQDINLEFGQLVRQEAGLLDTVRALNARLAQCAPRENCLMCGAGAGTADKVEHRGLPFLSCTGCGHIQSAHQPDAAFEDAVTDALGYKVIYPQLDKPAYLSRCERIYKPKADWAFDALAVLGRDPKALRWAEIGCGAGNFLHVLREAGCARLSGFDRDAHNIRLAREALGADLVTDHQGSVADIIAGTDADIYTAFYVMEHVDSPLAAAKALAAKPAGTLFLFAVPCFGFSTLFESAVEDHYPRCLDGMMHTQLYTDRSIDWLMEQAHCDIVSQWVFGQDAMDLARFMAVHLKDRYPAALYEEAMKKIGALVDPLQAAIDKAWMADSRHILAVRRG